MPDSNSNRFAALVDSRGYAKLDDNKYKRRRNFFNDNKEEEKYVIIKKIDETQKSFQGVSPFLIEKGLSMITCYIKETQRLRSGDLLVLTSKDEGFQKLLNANKLADITIKVEEHKFLNTSKGVIYSRDLMSVKEEEIANELKSQKVVKVERIKRKVNNELIDTPLHIVTFNTVELPLNIRAGFLRLDVRQYIPNPMRCHNCQRYGHTKAKCSRVPVCPKCANHIPNGHENIKCEPIMCANCKTNHTTFDQQCPTFLMEKAIVKIKTIERITYIRAKEIYYRQNANTTGATTSGQNKTTYSQVLQQKPENHNNIQLNQMQQRNTNSETRQNINNNNKNQNNKYDNNNKTNNNNINNIYQNENKRNPETVPNNQCNNNNTNENKNETTTQRQETVKTREPTTTRGSATGALPKTTTTTIMQQNEGNMRYRYLSPAERAIAMEEDGMQSG